MTGRAARLLRDDRDRPRLERAGDRDHRDLRRRRAASSWSTRPTSPRARTTSATPPATAAWPSVFAQLEVDGEQHGVHALLVPLRDEDGQLPARRHASRTAARSWASRASTTAGSAFDNVRVPRTALLDRYATVGEDGLYESPIENKNRRFFTTIGTLIQGRVSVERRVDIGDQVGAHDRGPLRAAAPPVRPAGRRPRGAADGLPRAPAPAAPARSPRPTPSTSPSARSSPSCTGARPRTTTPTASGASSRRRAAGVKAAATWHATDDDPDLPRGVRRRRLPRREPLQGAEGRHRRLHHLRGRQHGAAPARRQGPADRLQGALRRPQPARDDPLRRRAGVRDRSSSGRSPASS